MDGLSRMRIDGNLLKQDKKKSKKKSKKDEKEKSELIEAVL